MYYSSGMAYSLRSDPELEAAFATLGVTPGTRSRIIRQAVLALADTHRREQLRAEAEDVRADPDDQAELRMATEDLDSVRAW